MTLLPKLYKQNKNGIVQVCEIGYEQAYFTVVWGQVGGGLRSQTTECFTTNAGKSNERLPEQQAIFEANALHTKKQDSGYVLDESGKSTVRLAMKVKEYQKQLKNIDFTSIVYTSPKLDGVNAIFRLEDGVLTCYSRGGKEYPMLEHLRQEVTDYLTEIGEPSLNCELYRHGWHLQEITAAVKAFKPATHSRPTSEIKAHIFDLPDNPDVYAIRQSLMYEIDMAEYSNLVRVPVTYCRSLEDIETKYNEAMSQGYEGLIVRNARGLYKYNERSIDVFKYKKQLEGEYQVTNYKKDKLGHVVYECITPEGLTFNVKRKGTAAERLADAEIADTNIGKWLNISYESFSLDKKPLKPTGNYFRTKVNDTFE